MVLIVLPMCSSPTHRVGVSRGNFQRDWLADAKNTTGFPAPMSCGISRRGLRSDGKRRSTFPNREAVSRETHAGNRVAARHAPRPVRSGGL